ncbi:DNA segregation ATPase FtsK/SpoIIIE, S-DNA-T family [Amycolatopsis sacchari]|uniref:DNA segregation ATPase FtsK/SpoIIIE, S-DNA-T family n=1 Tax=Amycolatopsis sacchari TaxID=115433 RepID=A0A1I3VA12_9PSEU|nr:FtsK/SpoIIIE domain-containing protein [Amycolatopsis sacchari]SFJ91216.1 DNA segregation ATPase FtsK/SpoIIIE, S-DNA-T family [Amycolatopsis sacchari]
MSTDNDREELARVHYLPSHNGADTEVIEGELISDEEYALLTSQKAQALERYRGYRRDAVTVYKGVRYAATHDYTKTAGKTLMRHGSYVLGGAGVLAKRVWEAKTNSRYERLLRAAEVQGDWERLGEWEQRAEQAREHRHRRRMDWLDAPAKLVKAVVIGAASLIGFLFALGIVLAVASKDLGKILGPIEALLQLVQWIAWVVTVVWGPLVLAAPWVVVLALWNIGRRAGAAPSWLSTGGQRSGEGEPITPSIVVTALRDLGIAKLATAIKEMGDAGASMLGPIRLAGCGVEVDVTLPSGVTTEEVQRKRRKLAENLTRHEHEVFITIPQAARTVRLWIADSGALDEPIGPSPLVTDPDTTADLYTGRAPWGQDLRGDAAAIALLQRHLLITGLSNQGKTAALRALVLWLALDTSTEFRIADLKGVGDWRMFEGLATRLIQGPTDEHVIATTEMLEEGVAEMERRIAALEASGATDGVTREMARYPGSGFHPIFLVVDEAQVAFMCPAIGEDKRPYGGTKNTSRYFMAARKIHNQGRAVNVHLWQGTQDPTDQNLPKLVREGAHIRASLVVGTEEQARMALGDKAVNGGAAPHKLRQGADKGTVVVAGDGVPLPAGQASITIRTHFINGEDATEVAERAKTRRGTVITAEEGPEERDLLDDVAEVLGTEAAVKATDVAARLRELAPEHTDYRKLTAEGLAAWLASEGVVVKKVNGTLTVRARMIHAALADRDDD